MMAVVSGGLTACSAGSADPTGLGASTARGSDDGQATGGGAANGGATASGTLRLRCEVRPGRSKISVDGNNLSPRNGTFTARVASGPNNASSAAPAQAIGDEVEFDFDSATGEVGATRIASNFIVGATVTAEIRSGERVVVSGSAQCEVR